MPRGRGDGRAPTARRTRAPRPRRPWRRRGQGRRSARSGRWRVRSPWRSPHAPTPTSAVSSSSVWMVSARGAVARGRGGEQDGVEVGLSRQRGHRDRRELAKEGHRLLEPVALQPRHVAAGHCGGVEPGDLVDGLDELRRIGHRHPRADHLGEEREAVPPHLVGDVVGVGHVAGQEGREAVHRPVDAGLGVVQAAGRGRVEDRWAHGDELPIAGVEGLAGVDPPHAVKRQLHRCARSVRR